MRSKWWVLAAVACGTFMATLDTSIVNVALPTLKVWLSTDLQRVKWIVVAYLAVITCLLMPMGRISDSYGKKRVYLSGFLIFSVGSALCGMATSLGSLVAFRITQAVGAAMLMANGPAIITAVFPQRNRGAALGILAMVVSLGLVTGPVLGGYLISRFGWPTIFWVNLPVAALGMVLVYLLVEPDPPLRRVFQFDWAGSFLQMILVVLFMLLVDPPRLLFGGDQSLEVPRWALLIGFAVFAAIFAQVERLASAPVFDFSLLKNRTFAFSNLAGFLFFICLSPIQVLMPFYLESVLGLATSSVGILMASIPLTIFVVAPCAGRLSDVFGSRWLSLLGALLATATLAAMSGLFKNPAWLTGLAGNEHRDRVIGFLIAMGMSVGLFQSPNNSAIMNSVPSNKLGTASALLATVRNLGLVTGAGLSTSMVGWQMSEGASFLVAYRGTLVVGAAVALAAVLASFGKGRS